MSGHNKWSTIKHKKGAADAKRGKIFSKIAKEITIVVKASGGNPDNNPTLRTLLEKAKSVNMPNDNITRAIKKGTGELAPDVLEEITYEGYAQGGVGLVINVSTSNKNRAAAEIRSIFKKNGSEFATPGSVSRNFERKGTILVPKADGVTEDKLMEVALDAGAEDIVDDGDGFTVSTPPKEFYAICQALTDAGINYDQENSEVGLVPMMYSQVTDPAVAKAVNRFVNALEENEDVQDVYHNMEIDDSIADQVEEE
ncbi:MAG: YebC/PmpR family DNA-binding transcriptional regulator [Kiritimatiellae bacterium]|nr:YebC/PmpR family DNA-binding transcriptional regulator [Kiritimatiellia bacterium]